MVIIIMQIIFAKVVKKKLIKSINIVHIVGIKLNDLLLNKIYCFFITT